LEYFIRFAQPVLLVVAACLLLVIMLLRLFWYKGACYYSPLAALACDYNGASQHWYKKILFGVRCFSLVLLVILIGKPQIVDSTSKATTQGINIMVVLDVSGSMQEKDFGDELRSRFDVAKDEAIRFIKNRPNDAIGVVLFGKYAVSRCPLTFDKRMLETILSETRLGVIDPDGTVLSRGIVTAANRLKNAAAKSNVMIVLTDGEPSPEDIESSLAVELAQQLKIKIYTIGIGGERRMVFHPLYGPIPVGVNKELLTAIAQKTGGRFFMALNAQDMRDVYQTIDALEKSELEAPIFTHYYDIFMPGVWIILGLLLLEILLTATIWFGL
jgi:Ca-activated chloride channel homolog